MPLDDPNAPGPGDDSASAPDPGSTGATSQGNRFAHVTADTIDAANNIFQGDYYNIISEQRRSGARQFAFSDGRVVTEIEEQRAVEHYAGGDGAELVRHLEEWRVLLLTAEAGARKVTAATHLALQLKKRGVCRRSTLVFDAIERHVRVDVGQMPLKFSQLKDRLVIFRYPLSRGNPDLAHAFGKTDRAGWLRLADTLRQCNAYLVFTATPAQTERFQDVRGLLAVQKTLAPHTSDVVARRLDAQLAGLAERGKVPAEALDALRAARGQLVRRFPFAPQLADFVEFYLDLNQPSLTIDQALTLFNDPGKRLLHDLDNDFDGWLFGFALTLAHCTPNPSGVAWVDFDRLRRHLHRWLRRDLELTTGPRTDEEQADPGELRLELSDDSLLTRTRARVEKDPATLADVAEFRDGRPAQGLWRMLLRHHRRVLTAILPRLRDLAERPDPDGRSLSVLAAQIIGRIGEIDYERVVVPMAERWARLANGRHRGLVGAMFEGVLGSDEPEFRARCLRYLRSMHEGNRPAKERLEAAIAAYSWVGYYHIGLAMRELHGIVQTHLVPMIDDAARMSQQVARVQRQIEQEARRGDEWKVLAVREELRRLVDNIYSEQSGVFVGVQFALVSLCETHGVTPVLRQLHEWIKTHGARMGVVLGLMFLHERGIASQLHDNRIEVPLADGAPPASCGQFVRALANGDEDVRQAVLFLADLHECVNSSGATEPQVRQLLRDRLQAHLVEWVREALPAPELLAPVRALFEQLALVDGGKARDLVVQVVRCAEFRTNPELRAFEVSLRLWARP